MANILEPYIEIFVHSKFGVLAIDVTLATILVVITAEFLPKALFRINPNGILTFFSVPFAIVYVLLFPVVFITIGLSELLLQKVFRFSLNKDQIVFGRVDLDSYIKQFTSIRDESKQFDHEITIFQNALDFGSVKVRDCMIPRNEIVGIEADCNIKELKEKFIETHLSKIIIYKENLDNVIGYVHSNELFKKPESIKEVLRPIAIIPETMHAKETLTQLKKERKSIAVVVDEFGGTSGLVTIEDLMEEIFGEIDDEHDKEEMTEQKISYNKRVTDLRANDASVYSLEQILNGETWSSINWHKEYWGENKMLICAETCGTAPGFDLAKPNDQYYKRELLKSVNDKYDSDDKTRNF
jgi:CBS domain containing-hemolysin-like protein